MFIKAPKHLKFPNFLIFDFTDVVRIFFEKTRVVSLSCFQVSHLYQNTSRDVHLLTLKAPSYPKLHLATAPINLSIIASFN